MNVNLPSYTLRLADQRYLLEFQVVDPYEIEARLVAARDVTKTDTTLVLLSTQSFIINTEIDEESGDLVEDSMESTEAFAARAWAEADKWAHGEIASHQEALKIHRALARVLQQHDVNG